VILFNCGMWLYCVISTTDGTVAFQQVTYLILMCGSLPNRPTRFVTYMNLQSVWFFSPQLTWRDLQHITVLTARRANLETNDWVMNGAGRMGI